MHKLIIILAIVPLIPMVVPEPFDWDAGNVVLMSSCALLSFGWSKSTPYTDLRLKSLLLAFSMFSALDVLLYPVRYLMAPYIVYALEVCAVFIFLLYIQNKWYNRASDDLDDEHFFSIETRPRNLAHQVVSWFTKNATGGVGVLAGEDFYHYRRKTWMLEKSGREHLEKNLHKYLIIRHGPLNRSYKDLLDKEVGTKWTLVRNCMTVLKPIVDHT